MAAEENDCAACCRSPKGGLERERRADSFARFFEKNPSRAPSRVTIAGKIYLCRPLQSIKEGENQVCLVKSGFRNLDAAEPSKHHTPAQRDRHFP